MNAAEHERVAGVATAIGCPSADVAAVLRIVGEHCQYEWRRYDTAGIVRALQAAILSGAIVPAPPPDEDTARLQWVLRNCIVKLRAPDPLADDQEIVETLAGIDTMRKATPRPDAPRAGSGER